ncbi:putative Sugar Porter (SP) Family MFS Transporter [Monocercomonoides exilis]|uniref:putative Sugar Porter (SP) Family MFS Transporter n=1 Tax=Monocercomonoides exilis TaxID=2049356 RepID=UPI00355A838F|nr:putative Sugar Porter (SP) Family MFS Transporter [Monocercomonoides exilis]|eukprot:MONOS_1324.1-p1 / transcript=MONOS_1324.1 / gene=MONOS_1324 / organism=Monocercomonoides_exilis_PA203 / gene_product=Sugar Porter (SP) Family MFS Transporter / transcript_product=Sugar Porter (SP) Family MFS Transporter / location=Mono_scaffold00022:221564-223716(-) / protein_length=561 / sequence_SO=supercontig / SO=protein_coding / is_pseudo=false
MTVNNTQVITVDAGLTDQSTSSDEKDHMQTKESNYDPWAGFVSLCGGMTYGSATGIISGVQGEYHWAQYSVDELSVFASSLIYGVSLGTLISSPLTNAFGRKKILLIFSVVAFVFSLIMAFMSNIYVMIVMRALNGIGIGVICAITPLYSSELASDKRRGILVSLFQVFITVGILLAYIFNLAFCNVNDGWHYELGLNSLFPLLIAVGSFLLPESPIWENKKKEEKSKLDALAASGLPAAPKQSAGQVAKHYLKVYKRHPRAVIVSIVLALTYQLTGLNILMYYAPSLLSQAGITTRVLSLSLTVVIGLWNTACSIVPLFIVDRFGRKLLLIVGSIIQAIGMLLVALSYTVSSLGEYSYAMAIPGMVVFLAGFEFGIGPVFFIVINEVLPPSVSALSSSISQFIMWIGNIVIILVFQPIANGMTMGGFFFLLMGICVLQLLFSIFVVRETKGKRIPEDDGEETESEKRERELREKAKAQEKLRKEEVEMEKKKEIPMTEMSSSSGPEQGEENEKDEEKKEEAIQVRGVEEGEGAENVANRAEKRREDAGEGEGDELAASK